MEIKFLLALLIIETLLLSLLLQISDFWSPTSDFSNGIKLKEVSFGGKTEFLLIGDSDFERLLEFSDF